jgi:hypothetical protein
MDSSWKSRDLFISAGAIRMTWQIPRLGCGIMVELLSSSMHRRATRPV